MAHFFIISGGTIEEAFVRGLFAKQRPDALIAADSGMDFCYRNGIRPDVIVGDFDSADRAALDYFEHKSCLRNVKPAVSEQEGVRLIRLNPVKDDTDTEYAVRLAIAEGASEITLLGGTGSRLDHVLGNIELLGIGLRAGVPVTLLDAHNRVRMTECGITIARDAQFGKYVSLIPYTEQVEHLYLRGFKYPLTDYCLRGFCSLGVSNEIIAEQGEIAFDGGILLVIESRDKSQ